jgi:diguanylate cyclase (GGDEF)-like protein
MNELVDVKRSQDLSVIVSASFLVIHSFLLMLFSRYGIVPMARFNVFSILFYLFSFVLIWRRMFRAYVVSVYLEVVLHMSLAVACVGFGTGFEVTLIGMSIMAFFAEYLERSISASYVPGVALGTVDAVAFVALAALFANAPAPYPFPPDVAFWMQVACGATTFTMTIFFLQIFVQLTFGSERIMAVRITHDKLTGLPNRYLMRERLREIESGGHAEKYWAAMVDIDDFKHINDAFGHNCGDRVLVEVARLLESGKGNAQVCRWGGDEFLMVGPMGSGMDEVAERLDQLRRAIEGYGFWHEERRLRVTVTIGVAACEAGAAPAEWVRRADERLYEGKRDGKNRVVR